MGNVFLACDTSGLVVSVKKRPPNRVRSTADPEALVVIDLEEGLSMCRFVDEDDNTFRMQLDPIDRSRAQELLEEEPDLREYFASGEILTTEETIRELRQRVLLQVDEYVAFTINREEAGLVVEISDEAGES